MRPTLRILALSLFVVGCADSTPDVTESATRESSVEVRQQPLLDATGPNWMVVGGPGLVEMVGGSDGEPDELTGRFALEGQSIVDAQSGSDRWVVVGGGLTQPLDDEGLRLTEARDALNGDPIAFVEPAPNGFLIGGANGRLQLLDSQGEPTMTMVQVLSGGTISAAAHNGSAWLAGADNGNVVVLNDSLPLPSSPDGNSIDVGKPVRAIVADASGGMTNPSFLAFSTDSVVAVSGTGVPQPATVVQAGIDITAAEFGGGKVFIGTSDGRIGVATYGAAPSFSFTNVLTGAAVTRLVSNGTNWIALGANGQAQRFDNNGATLGTPVQISSRTDRPLVGAHWTGSRWLLVVGAIGFVAFVDDQLAVPRTLTPTLGGATIADASAGSGQVLVVGTGGAVQVLDDLGATVSMTAVAAGGADLNAAEWNGDNWLVAGSDGAVQLVSPQGAPVGNPVTLLNGQDVHFASWSGEFFLIGGAGGLIQVVRADGTQSGTPITVNGATDLYDARWSGREWLVVGADGAEGIYAIATSTSNGTLDATPAPGTQALRAVDFNGIEFLVAGDGGLVQRVSAQGMTVGTPTDVLTGFGIRDIYFNGVNYIVAGAFGSLRRLGQDYLPLRTPIAVLDREHAAAVVWTDPRGFAGGPCLTNELCLEGPCVGGLAGGRCCDSACDRSCESCFQDDTGEPDGTCAPVVAGKLPPVKEGSAGCQRQSESTCGLTGSCDGAGECEFYGADISCAEPICSLGRFTPAASCNGVGACGLIDELDCAPYAGCNIEGCVDTCNADQDCVDGYLCDAGACVEEGGETTGPTPGDDADEKGCCATIPATGGAGGWALLLCMLFVGRRRRG